MMTTETQSDLVEYLRRRISRSQLLKASAAGAVLAALPRITEAESGGRLEYPFFPQITSGRYQAENVGDMVAILHTMEHAAVALLSQALQSSAVNLQSNPLLLAVTQAALMEEQLHAEFMDAILAPVVGLPVGTISSSLFLQGTATQNTTANGISRIKFTLPSGLLTNVTTFLSGVELLENIFIGAYTAAVRELAELGQPMLAKWAAQILGVEAEHRALARAGLVLTGTTAATPPNNKGFETDYFLYVADAAKAMMDLGILGGSGAEIPLLSRTQARAAAGPMAAAVVQITPNNATTSTPTSATGLTAARGELTTALSGPIETPPGSPTGTGRAVLDLDPGLGQVCFEIKVSGITLPAIASHIHKGAPGTAGPIVVPLAPPPDAAGISSNCVKAAPALIADILANPAGYYVNVHTTDFPGGAVRGQLG